MRVSPLSDGTTVGKEIHHLRPTCLCREVEVIPPPSGIREDKQPSAEWSVSAPVPPPLTSLPMLSFRRTQAGWPAARLAPGAVAEQRGERRGLKPALAEGSPRSAGVLVGGGLCQQGAGVWAGWESEGLGLPQCAAPKFTPHTLA